MMNRALESATTRSQGGGSMHGARLIPLGFTLTALVATRSAAAQAARVGIGAGVIAPAGNAVISDNAGWHVLGNVAVDVPLTPVSVRAGGLYGQTAHPGGVAGHSSIRAGFATEGQHVPTQAPQV